MHDLDLKPFKIRLISFFKRHSRSAVMSIGKIEYLPKANQINQIYGFYKHYAAMNKRKEKGSLAKNDINYEKGI